MEYKILGRTGLRVSVIGYGGAVLGIPYYLAKENPGDTDVQVRFINAMHRAFELGINYFDTAPGYGEGMSEEIMGNALTNYRDKIFLASKVTYSGTPDTIRKSVEHSLKRLKTDYLDVMQFHGGYFNNTEVNDILKSGKLDCLEKLRDEGKISFIGITAEVPTGSLENMISTKRFDVLQICYNITCQLSCDHSRQVRGIAAMAETYNMGIITMRTGTSGFLQKLLSSEFGTAISKEAVTRMCIKYVLSTPEIDVALVGMRSPEEVEANVSLASNINDRYNMSEIHDRFYSPA